MMTCDFKPGDMVICCPPPFGMMPDVTGKRPEAGELYTIRNVVDLTLLPHFDMFHARSSPAITLETFHPNFGWSWVFFQKVDMRVDNMIMDAVSKHNNG